MAKENEGEQFQGLGFANIGDEPVDDSAPAQKQAGNPEIDALRAQVEELTRESRRSQDRLIQALAGRGEPAAPAQRESFAPQVDIDLSDLPDMSMDRDGFNKKLAEKIKSASVAAAVQTTGAAQREQQARSARDASFDSLWSDFQTRNPDLAKYDDIVEKQAKNLIDNAMSRGMDVDRYVLGNRDQFLEDVADATASRLEALGIALPDSGAGDFPATRATRSGANRTAGTFGGGRSRAVAPKEAAAKPSSLSDELKDVQRKMKYL